MNSRREEVPRPLTPPAKGLQVRGKVFSSLFMLTALVILLFYAIGLYLNGIGMSNVMRGLHSTVETETKNALSGISNTLSNLVLMEWEFLEDDTLRKLAIAHDVMSVYERTEAIDTLSQQLLRMKRFSPVVGEATAYFPALGMAISATQPLYAGMDTARYDALASQLFPSAAGGAPTESQALISAFPHRTSADVLCLIELTILPDVLLERLRALRADATNEIALLYPDGGVYAHTGSATALLDAAAPQGGASYAGVDFSYNGERYLAQSGVIEPLGLTAVFFFSIDDALSPVVYHRLWIWILTAVSAALLISYLAFFRRAVFTPLGNIYAAMERMGRGGGFHIDTRSNEFNTIYEQFTQMIGHVETLAGEVYEEKYRAQQAELMQLQMQIRPHFFYNTLFSIYRMAQHEGSDDIAFLSRHLSGYYAYITRSPKDHVPFRAEVEHMGNYLEIQRFRFGRRITTVVDPLPDAVAHERIPPLVIQPLVENAFTHGLHDKEEGGVLTVSFPYDEGSFSVVVWDNGGNMDEGSVAALQTVLEGGTLHESSALVNLHRRLQIRYGKEYGLVLSSVENSLQATVTFQRANGRNDEKEVDTDAVHPDRG